MIVLVLDMVKNIPKQINTVLIMISLLLKTSGLTLMFKILQKFLPEIINLLLTFYLQAWFILISPYIIVHFGLNYGNVMKFDVR